MYCICGFRIREKNPYVQQKKRRKKRMICMINEFDTPAQRTQNFNAHRDVMGDVSVRDIYWAVNYMEHGHKNDDSFDLDDVYESLASVLDKLRRSQQCPQCDEAYEIYVSDLPQYDFVCVRCNENFDGLGKE
jgi:formylmethanofuran dehydrogenase subunit E